MSIISDFEKRKVRYIKPTRNIGPDRKPIVETGYMSIVNPEVAQRIREERGEEEIVWDVKVRKRRKHNPQLTPNQGS